MREREREGGMEGENEQELTWPLPDGKTLFSFSLKSSSQCSVSEARAHRLFLPDLFW